MPENSPNSHTSAWLGPTYTTHNKTTRKPHVKTRTGCRVCKRRKVKCDETRPSCRNCIKHAVSCDYSGIPPQPEVQTSTLSVSSGLNTLNLLDLELLHNFTSSTYATLTRDPVIRDMWKTAVVRKAIGCDFVMHALLAVSGMHIAQSRPDQGNHYVSAAAHHHTAATATAVRLMNETSSQSQQQESLWIFSVLTMYYALATPRDSSSLLAGESLLPDWIFLFNGVRHLVKSLYSTSYTGMLSQMFKNGKERRQQAALPIHTQSKYLERLANQVSQVGMDGRQKEMYQESIHDLNSQISLVFSFHDRDTLDIGDAFAWHFSLDDEFLQALKEGTQEAVVIFAHSLIIFNRLDSQRWIQGWDSCLLSRAWHMLDEEHRLWVQWPMEEIGWVPP